MTIHEAAQEIVAVLDEAKKLTLPVLDRYMKEEERHAGKRVRYYELALERAKVVDWKHCFHWVTYQEGVTPSDEEIITDGKGNENVCFTGEFKLQVKGEPSTSYKLYGVNWHSYKRYEVTWRLFFAAVTLVSPEARGVIENQFGGYKHFRVG